ncbi:Putative cation-transporting P-type ATPase [Raoultella ornithinolytica]|nr:Putative cation-transporting P-type ATPase [Raoultella ornithinolytica]
MTRIHHPHNSPPAGDTAAQPAYRQTVEQVLAQNHSRAGDCIPPRPQNALASFGPNAWPEKKSKPAWLRFLAHFNDVLIFRPAGGGGADGGDGALGGYPGDPGRHGHQRPDRSRAGEQRREIPAGDPQHALQQCRVQRNGKHETLPTRDLVPGDIVILRAGDRVPADMRLIETHNLRVEEAILTGESTVVDKITDALQGELPLGDRTNMVFSGTTISAGGGVGVVTATGQDTELGHINR